MFASAKRAPQNGARVIGDVVARDRPVVYQQWRDLLFLHWEVPEPAIRTLVPAELAIDRFDGRAYVTVIPFAIPENRPAGVPRVLATRFLEVNVRTYVRGSEGSVGIYFFSLEASSFLAVVGARILYGLPYYLAAMSMERRGNHLYYTSRRHFDSAASLDVEYVIGDALPAVIPGTLDHFLLERYSLYVKRSGAVQRAQVRHRPYPLRAAQVQRLHETLVNTAHVARPASPACCHFSPGVDVEIYWRAPVQP